MTAPVSDPRLAALLAGLLGDPFEFLGLHEVKRGAVLRCFFPGAREVTVLDAATGRAVAPLYLAHPSGFFSGPLPRRSPAAYRLEVRGPQGQQVLEDPYRFGPVLGETDRYLLAEGTHLQAYQKLGRSR